MNRRRDEAQPSGGRGRSSPYYAAGPSGPGGPAAPPGQASSSRRESAVQRLKRKVRTLYEAQAALSADYEQVQHEAQHYKDRVARDEESHRLAATRLCKEIEYHKRLRLGAEQRALEHEQRLVQQQRQALDFDEAQSTLIEQSQLLVGKNADLTYKVKTLEAHVAQAHELQHCLEEQLNQALQQRDALEAELQGLLQERQQPALSALTIDEDDEGDDDDAET